MRSKQPTALTLVEKVSILFLSASDAGSFFRGRWTMAATEVLVCSFTSILNILPIKGTFRSSNLLSST